MKHSYRIIVSVCLFFILYFTFNRINSMPNKNIIIEKYGGGRGGGIGRIGGIGAGHRGGIGGHGARIGHIGGGYRGYRSRGLGRRFGQIGGAGLVGYGLGRYYGSGYGDDNLFYDDGGYGDAVYYYPYPETSTVYVVNNETPIDTTTTSDNTNATSDNTVTMESWFDKLF